MKTKKIPQSASEMTGYQIGMLVEMEFGGTSFWKSQNQVYAKPYAEALRELQDAGLLGVGKGSSTYRESVEHIRLTRLGGIVKTSIMNGMPTTDDLRKMIEELNRDLSKTLGEVVSPDFCSRPFKDILRDIEYDHRHALKSEVPGHIKSVKVSKGERISIGQVLFTIESMMMDLSIKAHKSGIVKDVCVNPGEVVKRDQALLYLE